MDEQKTTPPEEPREDVNTILKPLRTYERDIAEMIRSHQMSAADVAIAQKKKIEAEAPKKVEPRKEPAPAAPISNLQTPFSQPKVSTKIDADVQTGSMHYLEEKPKSKIPARILITASVIFLSLGALAFISLFVINITKKQNNEITKVLPAIIQSNEKKEIDVSVYITREQIFDRFLAIAKEASENDYIKEMVVIKDDTSKSRLTPEDFFNTIAPEIPASLTRSFGTNMMWATYTLQDKNTFFIISVDTFDRAFEGMIFWEKNMYNDIGAIMNIPKENISENISGTPLLQFEDVIVQNKDTRVLKDNQGETLILYSFINEDTLFIVNNEQTFKEILNRFESAKIVR